MAISAQRVVNLDPEVVIVAGSNDHLQIRGLLNTLIDGSTPSSEAVGEAIMTLLSAMTEAEKSIRQRFARQLVKVICLEVMPRYPNPCSLCTPWLSCWLRDDLM